MKRSTIMGLFIGLLSLTISAQITQKPTPSLQELLVKYENIGKESGSVSDYFSPEEQQLLRSYFNGLSPNKRAVTVKNSPAEAKQLRVAPEQRAAINYSVEPLFVAPTELTAAMEAELLADQQYRASLPASFQMPVVVANRNPLADIIPTVGATETFSPAVGDHFFDPGGPGGSSTSGTPGNYPNCGCDTQTTLLGVSEIEFQFFSVFGNFDYLQIYDGTDATGTLLYDNGPGGPNDGDITLADMIATNGSATFTSASGDFFFFFHASSVVDYGGWDAEIITASGGGGGGSTCSEENPNDFTFENGFNCSSATTFMTANDVTVAADTDFTLTNITASIFANGGIANVDVNYYADVAGLPGAVIGSQTSVTIDNQTVIGSNFGLDVNEVEMTVDPFLFAGQAGVDTKYWIELSVTDGGGTGSVFWVVTSSSAVGSPSAQFDGTIWGIPDPLMDGVYIWEGECEPIGGGGGGVCGTPILEVNQDVDDACMATISQTGLAQSYIPLEAESAGAGIKFTDPSTGLDVTLSLWDGLPNAGGTMLASGTSQTDGTNWTDVFWDPVVNVTVGNTYYIVIEGDTALPCVSGSTNNPYPDGNTFANAYTPFPNFDYTFRTYSCDGGGGGGVLEIAYGINNGNFELIGFPVPDPSTVEVFGDSPITVNFENAGAIDPANPTTGYSIDNGGQFYSFDITSGIYTLLGNIPGDWIGMEFDRTTGILYAIAGADLYTIDPVAVTATLVGPTGINPADLPIALAIDGAGVGYTYDLVNQDLYSIDLATATATVIGNIGFDANFGQGMCYDPTTDMVYMAAFNATSFTAEWRSVDLATGATTLIGPIVTTAAITQVAWVSIGESLPPPACPEPTNLAVSNITPTTADLSWDEEPNASSGYIWSVFDQGANPITDTPVSTGTTPAGTTSATATGLTGGLSYDFYVVADCDSDGLSQYAGPIGFATPPACGGKFYDTGGPAGNYENDANYTVTISPENSTDFVTVTFTAFDVEANWDALYVYDGPDTSAPLISSGNPPTNSGFPAGGYYGTSIIGPFASTHASGALTFVFMSDPSVPRAGWEADITCALTPPPNDLIANSIDVDELGFPYTDPAVHMPAATTEGGNPQGCDLTGANGVWYNFVAGGDGTAIASIVTPGGASSVTFYTAPDENAVETDLVLVSQNSNQCAPGTSASIYTLAGQAYYVFVLNTGAITDITIDGTNLGVDDNTLAGFSYYPNPTQEIINLKSVDNIETVSLYNILGQSVLTQDVNATTSQIDVSALSTGTYIMKVTVNGQTGTYKVLKD